MPEKHMEICNPSAAYRWLNCNPSGRLELEFENETSEAAEEGTAAHELGAYKILLKAKRQCTRPISKYEDSEMDRLTDEYSDYVIKKYERDKRRDPNTKLLVEQEVDFSCYMPLKAFGTADVIIASKGKLEIIDFKYGLGVLVDAYENPQMKIYALGALNLFENSDFNFKKVKMTIYQPRRDNISTYEITVGRLKKWAREILRPNAIRTYNGEGEYQVGPHCQFCRAKVKCRKRSEEALKIAQKEFKKPDLLGDEEIQDILPRIAECKKWLDDVWKYAEAMQISGAKEWNGFKVVLGKANRRYVDEDEVIEECLKAGYEDIFKKTLLSIAEMEKLMKKDFEKVLGDLVIKPDGKPTLVPLSDPRKAINTTKPEDEFK